jgi:hypothetical protein
MDCQDARCGQEQLPGCSLVIEASVVPEKSARAHSRRYASDHIFDRFLCKESRRERFGLSRIVLMLSLRRRQQRQPDSLARRSQSRHKNFLDG